MTPAEAEKAWELLARYLEQVREAGEDELYLDERLVRDLKRRLAAATPAPERPPGPRGTPRPTAAPAQPKSVAPARASTPNPQPKPVAVRNAAAPAQPKPAAASVPPREVEVVTIESILGVKKTAPDMFSEASPLERCSGLGDVERLASACDKCELARTRTKVVFGVGNPHARLMFIGEAPGHDEDVQGIPFVGRAGQLLDKILDAAGIARDDVYIANILKCRPPNNRTPLTSEIDACSPYLVKQLQFIEPKVVCALGLPATTTLLGLKGSMGSMRGKIYKYGDIRVIPTYHPAAALRDPNYKRPMWDDFLIVKREYERG
jgi:DNA polymerase